MIYEETVVAPNGDAGKDQARMWAVADLVARKVIAPDFVGNYDWLVVRITSEGSVRSGRETDDS